eukprot:3172-Heterococcus_DN1.PRE.2
MLYEHSPNSLQTRVGTSLKHIRNMQRATEQQLRREAQALAPNEAMREMYGRCLDQLCQVLWTLDDGQGTKVAAVIKAGSLGHSTSLVDSDLDALVRVHNAQHPELLPPEGNDKLLNAVHSALARNLPTARITRKTGYVVTIEMSEGGAPTLEVDVLFLRDFCVGTNRSAGAQACGALAHFRAQGFGGFSQADKFRQSTFSTAFTELDVLWMQMQSSFLRGFIRLAKHCILRTWKGAALADSAVPGWRAQCKAQGVSGWLISVLAVYVAEQREQRYPGGELKYTDLFLDLHELIRQDVQGERVIRVHFDPLQWKQPVPELVSSDSIFRQMYQQALANCSTRTPLIMKPSTPTTNLADSVTQHGWQIMLTGTEPEYTLALVSTAYDISRYVILQYKLKSIMFACDCVHVSQ